MSTENTVAEINKNLYDEAKIYWEHCQGWTSKLWKELHKAGFRSTLSNGGFIHVKDSEGRKIWSGNGRSNMLKAVGHIMR